MKMELLGYSPEQYNRVIELVSSGIEITAACASAKVNPHTFLRDLEYGFTLDNYYAKNDKRILKRDVPYVNMWRDVNAARAQSVISLHETMAESGDWRAAKFLLERISPERYGAHSSTQTQRESIFGKTDPLEIEPPEGEDDE